MHTHTQKCACTQTPIQYASSPPPPLMHHTHINVHAHNPPPPLCTHTHTQMCMHANTCAFPPSSPPTPTHKTPPSCNVPSLCPPYPLLPPQHPPHTHTHTQNMHIHKTHPRVLSTPPPPPPPPPESFPHTCTQREKECPERVQHKRHWPEDWPFPRCLKTWGETWLVLCWSMFPRCSPGSHTAHRHTHPWVCKSHTPPPHTTSTNSYVLFYDSNHITFIVWAFLSTPLDNSGCWLGMATAVATGVHLQCYQHQPSFGVWRSDIM